MGLSVRFGVIDGGGGAAFYVRLLAAKLTVELERTDAINDLKAAVDNEQNKKNKTLLKEHLKNLEAILGKNQHK